MALSKYDGIKTDNLILIVEIGGIPMEERLMIMLEVYRRQQQQIDDLVTKIDLVAGTVGRKL